MAAGAEQLHPEGPEAQAAQAGGAEQGALVGDEFDQTEESEKKEKNILPGAGTMDARKAAELAMKRIGGVKPTKPAEVVKLAIEGWYGDYLRNLHDNWQTRREDLESLIGFAQRFGDMNELLAQLVLLNSETGDRSVEANADTVRLTTIHQAKGLEFRVVFVIGVADGLLPLKRAIDEGDVEEERRLFYVAATRAMDELNVLYPRITTQGGPPTMLDASRFLLEIPPESFEQFRANVGLMY